MGTESKGLSHLSPLLQVVLGTLLPFREAILNMIANKDLNSYQQAWSKCSGAKWFILPLCRNLRELPAHHYVWMLTGWGRGERCLRLCEREKGKGRGYQWGTQDVWDTGLHACQDHSYQLALVSGFQASNPNSPEMSLARTSLSHSFRLLSQSPCTSIKSSPPPLSPASFTLLKHLNLLVSLPKPGLQSPLPPHPHRGPVPFLVLPLPQGLAQAVPVLSGELILMRSISNPLLPFAPLVLSPGLPGRCFYIWFQTFIFSLPFPLPHFFPSS